MDWFLDTRRDEAVTELRREIMLFLSRHSVPGSQLSLAELAVAELLGNVIRHAPGPAWVSLTWGDRRPTLTVYDLGSGFTLDLDEPPDLLAESGRGLFIVKNVVDQLDVASRAAGGARVAAVLPLERRDTESHDPPRHRHAALPGLDEADPAGGFGKESFLRALVVQLAQAIEERHGPAAAEAAVAQVGADVGGQMEAEYRTAKEIVGEMTPAQMADCYVRLKHAIEGDFYVIEASEERIVLGNTKCPFGQAVQRAPALCRMTSSVFGGIAARNTGEEATVVLEERIALGDSGCRVAVYLRGTLQDKEMGHRYRPPVVGA